VHPGRKKEESMPDRREKQTKSVGPGRTERGEGVGNLHGYGSKKAYRKSQMGSFLREAKPPSSSLGEGKGIWSCGANALWHFKALEKRRSLEKDAVE